MMQSGGVAGTPWAPQNGLQAYGFAYKYLKWYGPRIDIIEITSNV